MGALKWKILIVDDEDDIRDVLQERLTSLGYQALTAATGEEALEKVEKEDPDLMFLDLKLPQMDGLEVLKRLRNHFELPVIMITAHATVNKAVEAMKQGAFDFIEKDLFRDRLEVVTKRALERRVLVQENKILQEEVNAPYLEILGESKDFKEVVRTARKVAAYPSTVLLLGESGTGKEVFARSIHRWSPRAQNPFIVVNCVALRDELIESELFGHEKGAFTGAHQTRRGKIEIANGGTVFLDEIGDLKPDLQAKLLRVLQEREFDRVGGNTPIRVDIRVIAATNRDLRKAVQERQFREDLFFRLNVVTLSLPPLRERKDDIPLLANFFLRRSCEIVKEKKTISPEAREYLKRYHWPGNVRELANVIELAVILADMGEIMPKDLRLQPLSSNSDEGYIGKSYHESVRAFQRKLIRDVLQRSNGSQARTAEILDLQRTYLSRLIKKLNIKDPETKQVS